MAILGLKMAILDFKMAMELSKIILSEQQRKVVLGIMVSSILLYSLLLSFDIKAKKA